MNGLTTDTSVLELQARWNRIRIANLFDALDQLGFPNQCLDLSIRPLLNTGHLAGKAVTVRGARAPLTSDEVKERKRELDGSDLRRVVYPGAVIVVDSGGEPHAGKAGEMTCWAFKQRGAKGIVVDGFIRDYLGLLEIPDFTVCSRGTSPIESDGRWRMEEINTVIGLPGTLTSQVRIVPGDWIVGGPDGVIVVPEQISMEALNRSEGIEESEQGMRTDLAKGMSFEDAFEKWGRA